MSRPKLDTPPVIVPIKLSLHPGEDDDLIAFFIGIPDGLRNASVKQALRGGITGHAAGADTDPDADLLDALDNLIG